MFFTKKANKINKTKLKGEMARIGQGKREEK